MVHYRKRVGIRSTRGGTMRSVAMLCLLAAVTGGCWDPSTTAPAPGSNAPPPMPPVGAVTFYKDILPIVQAHCQTCHVPGGIGPFALVTVDDVKARIDDVIQFTTGRIMPPWKAA